MVSAADQFSRVTTFTRCPSFQTLFFLLFYVQIYEHSWGEGGIGLVACGFQGGASKPLYLDSSTIYI